MTPVHHTKQEGYMKSASQPWRLYEREERKKEEKNTSLCIYIYIYKVQACFFSGNLLLRIFALEGFVKALLARS